MLTYKAAYYFDEDGVSVQALDFPAVLSCGKDLDEARKMIRSALVDVTEYMLDKGEPLPIPDPSVTDPEADLEEPLYLLIQAASQISIIPQEVGV